MLFPLKKRKKAYLKGIWAEKIASLYLQCNGYTILERRFKTSFGEIDLISRKGSYIVAVEVKMRVNHEKAALSISPYQMRRIQNTLSFYAKRCSSLDLRFDVILISPWKWPRHIQGAWSPD